MSKNADIIVRPNIATAKVGGGVTTHPDVLECILAFLHRKGIIFRDVPECDYNKCAREHRMARVSPGMKNMKGCIPDVERVRFHVTGLHDHIFKLNRAPDLTVMRYV
ncbi:MAG: DUF362 domain-containing protein [Canidatus Methanoxibalbensis ujae]|nr:DUF362 domain-containing protein [Candidatus Methanoxibalbensis ujae]